MQTFNVENLRTAMHAASMIGESRIILLQKTAFKHQKRKKIATEVNFLCSQM